MELNRRRKMLWLLGLVGIGLMLPSGGRAMLMQRSSHTLRPEIVELISTLHDEHLRESDPERVAKAITRLGELRATVAINDLVQLITFRRTFAQEQGDPDAINEIHVVTPGGRYPAIGALFEIGKPSLPALVKVIKTHESGSLESENATTTVMMIFRESPSNGVKFLEEAALKASPLEAQRLKEAAARAKRYEH